jgi:hypothetical protein
MTNASIITVQASNILEAVKTLNSWWTLEDTRLPYVVAGTPPNQEEVDVAVRIETSRGDKFVTPHIEGEYLTLGTWDIPKLRNFLDSDEWIYRS